VVPVIRIHRTVVRIHRTVARIHRTCRFISLVARIHRKDYTSINKYSAELTEVASIGGGKRYFDWDVDVVVVVKIVRMTKVGSVCTMTAELT